MEFLINTVEIVSRDTYSNKIRIRKLNGKQEESTLIEEMERDINSNNNNSLYICQVLKCFQHTYFTKK
jgi:hypothetical protein